MSITLTSKEPIHKIKNNKNTRRQRRSTSNHGVYLSNSTRLSKKKFDTKNELFYKEDKLNGHWLRLKIHGDNITAIAGSGCPMSVLKEYAATRIKETKKKHGIWKQTFAML